ncbi:hypothetical protein CCAN11_310001 [Capnocytophaga canimorsus]|uniref:Uncharacterized protein n=1 Tax=Capnocytophaga canimorsus TaxID=28188 RepID=A0A0B7ISI3_9FLAO|nr:hypothetical protein CCAN11_310001 [Capnocytophaga canimorsus]
MIDRFLETNPKIEPFTRICIEYQILANEVKTDPHQLMTETFGSSLCKQRNISRQFKLMKFNLKSRKWLLCRPNKNN